MAQILFSNFATTTLAGAITTTSLSLAVQAGSGVEFPTPGAGQYFTGVISDAATNLVKEIVQVTKVAGDTLTIVRAQQGTTAANWNAGDLFGNLLTAGDLAQFQQNGLWNAGEVVAGVDTGSASNIVVTSANTNPTYLASTPPTDLVLIVAPIAVNSGPTTITLNGAKAPVIYPNGSPFLGGETQPRPQVFIFDGTSWEWQAQQSPVLSTAANFYVNGATGSDANNGLTAGAPFATIQRAIAVVQALNPNGNAVTVNVANGTYAAFSVAGPVNGTLVVQGNTGTPSSCVISAPSNFGGPCVNVNSGAKITISGFRLINASTTLAFGLQAIGTGSQIIHSQMDFNSCNAAHIRADSSGQVSCGGSYTISGSAPNHVLANAGTVLVSLAVANTITLTGTPAFSDCFVSAVDAGIVRASTLTTFSGSATGKRFSVNSQAVIETVSTGNVNFFPGSSAGTWSDGGRYVGVSDALVFTATAANISDFSANGSFVVMASVQFVATSNVAIVDGSAVLGHGSTTGTAFYAYVDILDTAGGTVLATGPSIQGYLSSTYNPNWSPTPVVKSAALVYGRTYTARLQMQRAAANGPTTITNPSVQVTLQ